MNLIGDLDTYEILEQVALITRLECFRKRPAPRNVVFMGMGEPLANYGAVSAAVTRLCDPFHFALRKKGVTVSTVGVAPALRNMKNMFGGAESFNQPLNNWNVSKVIAMDSMFWNATSFNQPLNNWSVSNVRYMGGMFDGATSFNHPLLQPPALYIGGYVGYVQ